MIKKNFYIICAIIIVLSNVLMMSVVNSGEEVMSNLFIIVLVLFFIPRFLWAADNQMTREIRVESVGLVVVAILSLMRLINRMVVVPDVVNIVIVIAGLVLGTVQLVVAISRLKHKED